MTDRWQVRSSRVMRRWQSGQAATCMRVHLRDPQSAELAALSGVDCLWLDMEHVPTGWETLQSHIAVAKSLDVDTLVRVAGGAGYSDIIKPLELDATGVMFPHVDSAEQARDIVQKTKFYPLGMRPVDGGNADARYRLVPLDRYLADSNAQRFTAAMIESPEGMAHLEAICDTPGIDLLLFGAVDYSQAIGRPGDTSCAEVMAARERVAATARRHGKHVIGGSCIGEYHTMVSMGYDFIVVGTDVHALAELCREVSCVLGQEVAHP